MFAHEAVLEICPLETWPSVPSSYIVCAEDRTVRPEWRRRAASERLGVDPIELSGGHCPHVSRPRELAEVLSALAVGMAAPALTRHGSGLPIGGFRRSSLPRNKNGTRRIS